MAVLVLGISGNISRSFASDIGGIYENVADYTNLKYKACAKGIEKVRNIDPSYKVMSAQQIKIYEADQLAHCLREVDKRLKKMSSGHGDLKYLYYVDKRSCDELGRELSAATEKSEEKPTHYPPGINPHHPLVSQFENSISSELCEVNRFKARLNQEKSKKYRMRYLSGNPYTNFNRFLRKHPPTSVAILMTYMRLATSIGRQEAKRLKLRGSQGELLVYETIISAVEAFRPERGVISNFTDPKRRPSSAFTPDQTLVLMKNDSRKVYELLIRSIEKNLKKVKKKYSLGSGLAMNPIRFSKVVKRLKRAKARFPRGFAILASP